MEFFIIYYLIGVWVALIFERKSFPHTKIELHNILAVLVLFWTLWPFYIIAMIIKKVIK